VRRNATLSVLSLAVLLQLASTRTTPAAAQVQSNGQEGGAFATTVAYVVQFYPLWFAHGQYALGTPDRLVGPAKVNPFYQIVVAINVDTVYASTYADLTVEPMVVTIPSTTATYSILTLDPYGDVLQTNLVAGQPGTYALTGPGWSGTLPSGITAIPVPLNRFALLFRIDKYSADGTNQIAEARSFRRSLRSQTFTSYEMDPTAGEPLILPSAAFAVPFKTVADALVANNPIAFLRQLQRAVASSITPPMTPYEQQLSRRFDSLFADGEPTGAAKAAFSLGAQAAHTSIIQQYLNHTDAANWINFTNIGDWGRNVIQRSGITEYIQYANGHSAAAYYHTFKDSKGRPLDGSHDYVLTFPADQIPQAKRFWSVTAYTPESVELIGNPANKYHVASYTPGLVRDPDGSVSIYIAQHLPDWVPHANWLPVSTRPFNIMLRVYGPEGDVAAGTYVPPAIVRVNGNSGH
jgi:hypothetical protein